jgi:uncharacterized membrane protein YvlD (DUF360 family)
LENMPKLFMTLGVIIFVIGVLMKWIHFGKLPGDLIIKKEQTTIYFPIMTSIIISVVLSVIFYVISRFR